MQFLSHYTTACRIMRLSILQLMIAGLFMVSAHARESSAQDLLKTNISIRAEKMALQNVLSIIEQQANVRFAYSRSMIQVKQEVSIRAENQSLDRVLDELFKGSEIDYQVARGQIILKKRKAGKFSSEDLPGSDMSVRWIERSISGRVTEKSGEPLPGVSVLLKGTQRGTVTDIDGRFQLDIPNDDAVLVFSFVGYKTEEVVVGNRTSLDLSLETDEKALDEVIVMGYGTMKKRDVLGSVSTVKADDLQKLNPSSMDAALQGLASGVTVTSSGVPGAPVQVKVRGINSISSNTDPLWIVDGIPVVTGSIGNDFNGATNQNVLSMIDPADIESMQVLKDAAATAIYGSRGSNGVILVTTKSGKAGKSTFDVDYRTGVSNWTKTDIGIASGREFVEIMDLVRQNSRLPGNYEPVQSLGQLDTYATGLTREEAMNINTRWADEISRLGGFHDIRISASNGSEKTSSYLSLNYRKDKSNLKFGGMQTLSGNFNIKHKVFSFLNLGYRMMASYTDNDRISSGDGKQGTGGWGQVNSNALPIYKVYDREGVNGYWNPLSMINPLASMDPRHSENNLKALNMLTGLSADVTLPVDGLSLHGDLGMNYVNSHALSWISDKVRILGSRAQEDKTTISTLNYNAYFNYDRSFGDHNLNVVAGGEGTRRKGHYSTLTGIGLVGPFHEIGTPSTLTGSSALGGESYLMGFFGRANYNFRDKYYVGFSMRRDGISKFIDENRWATFVSGSLGWVISEESFFNIDAINLLKLRGSYGQTGNTNIPTGITEDIWTTRTGDGTL